jgi:hypothetical protein
LPGFNKNTSQAFAKLLQQLMCPALPWVIDALDDLLDLALKTTKRF